MVLCVPVAQLHYAEYAIHARNTRTHYTHALAATERTIVDHVVDIPAN